MGVNPVRVASVVLTCEANKSQSRLGFERLRCRRAQEKGVTGAAQCAADAVTATVTNAKNIPPLLEMEAKQLLIKARTVASAWL